MKHFLSVLAMALSVICLAVSSEIPFNKADEFPSSAYGLIAKQRAIWFGEMHGTRECPQLFLGLVKLVIRYEATPAVVALEIPATEQAAINRYLESGNESFLWSSPFFKSELKDGRSSVAMVGLLSQLRTEKKAAVICFDSFEATSPQERDSAMAKNLLAAAKKFPNAKLLVLSGNGHARLKQGASWDPAYRPAAFELAKKVYPVVSFQVSFESGTMWAYMEDGFGEHKVKGEPWSGTEPYYIKLYAKPERGYSGAIFTRTLTGSPPW